MYADVIMKGKCLGHIKLRWINMSYIEWNDTGIILQPFHYMIYVFWVFYHDGISVILKSVNIFEDIFWKNKNIFSGSKISGFWCMVYVFSVCVRFEPPLASVVNFLFWAYLAWHVVANLVSLWQDIFTQFSA